MRFRGHCWWSGRSLIPVLLALALILMAGPGAAQADAQPTSERRMALVVGNGAYRAMPRLANAVRDAERVAEELDLLGFEVTFLRDADLATFEVAVEGFAARAEGAAATLFYFSGHGFQVQDVNYLAPRDAELTDMATAGQQMIRLDSVIAQISARGRPTVILLDACRNDPRPPALRGSLAAGFASPQSVGTDIFMAFATRAGEIASDGPEGGHSQFTQALLDHMATQGQSISDMMAEVTRQVQSRTLGLQTPWVQGNSVIGAEFRFNPLQISSELYDTLASMSDEQLAVVLPFWTGQGARIDMAEIDSRRGNRPVSLSDLPFTLEVIDESPAVSIGEAGRVLDETPPVPTPPVPTASVPTAPVPTRPMPTRPVPTPSVSTAPVRERPGAEPDRAGETALVASLAPAAGGDAVRSVSPLPELSSPLQDRFLLRVLPPLPVDRLLVAQPRPLRRVIAEDVTRPEAPDDLPRAVQTELARVGCYTMRIDGAWGPGSVRSLQNFVSRSGLSVEGNLPTEAVWRLVSEAEEGICPPPPVAAAPASQPTVRRTPANQQTARPRAPQTAPAQQTATVTQAAPVQSTPVSRNRLLGAAGGGTR
ncbi:MAG: caspase family protein [Pararhodobacter sp.]